MRKYYNPERKDWKGRSYKKGGKLIQDLKQSDRGATDDRD